MGGTQQYNVNWPGSLSVSDSQTDGRFRRRVLSLQWWESDMYRASPSVALRNALLSMAALALGGCWTLPVADVQPKGDARLIQSRITVISVKNPAIVQSVDLRFNTVTLLSTQSSRNYSFRIRSQDGRQLRPGDEVRATVKEELAIYVLKSGQTDGANGLPGASAVDARVLSVDPSYRLLTLEYPNKERETLKVPLGTRLDEMEAGDSVVVRPVEVLRLRQKG